MNEPTNVVDSVLAKLDSLASAMTSDEQRVLAGLLAGPGGDDADDVSGFIMDPWPTSKSLVGEVRLTALSDSLSSGHTTGFASARGLGQTRVSDPDKPRG